MSNTNRPVPTELQRSSRDPAVMQQQLEAWLTGRLPDDAKPRITGLSATSTTGLSSDTILFSAEWDEGAGRQTHELVARIAPDAVDVPVFPSYDLERQYRVIDDVGRRSRVPVPDLYWSEPDAHHVGAPFFVMGRVDGVVPPDLMPYTFGDNWLHDAAPSARQRLQSATVAVLADLHGIAEAPERFDYLAFIDNGDTALRRHVAHTRAWYDWVAEESGTSPLIDRGFVWLDDHWPAEEGETVVSWGDSRIGNILYRDFTPVAVLDWEMAGLGPRELDLAWLIYSHRVFEDIAHSMGLPGMPDFMRHDDVLAEYERVSDYAPTHLDFYGTYAAVQWAIVFVRTARRSVHFGEREMPDLLDEVIVNRDGLEAMFAGTYWT
jgi:aminoglycoside phosphotransferase (APT) family kinase protein